MVKMVTLSGGQLIKIVTPAGGPLIKTVTWFGHRAATFVTPVVGLAHNVSVAGGLGAKIAFGLFAQAAWL